MSTAAQIGSALTQRLQASTTAADHAEIVGYVDALLSSEGRTTLDALAFVSLAQTLATATAASPIDTSVGDVLVPLATVVRLLSRAVEALESVTGYAADGFSAATRDIN